MKTTIEIADALLREAKNLAAREGTTLRALVERGLRQVVAGSAKQKKAFRYRPVVVTGAGLQPEFQDADGNPDWEKIRDAIYEGRGA
jgi:hypothetical protein